MDEGDTISVPVWVGGGGMMVLRDSLDPSHPESTYSYIKNVLKECPEDFGYYCTELSDEQKDLLRTIPDDAIFRECQLREMRYIENEKYG